MVPLTKTVLYPLKLCRAVKERFSVHGLDGKDGKKWKYLTIHSFSGLNDCELYPCFRISEKADPHNSDDFSAARFGQS